MRDAAPPRALTLVLLWHMHQPEYRDYASGEFRMPWAYLHALKDYADMAWHLETHPGVRAVVNFTPVLLEQLDDYAAQFAGGRFRDPLLRLLARPADALLREADRALILQRAFAPEHASMAQSFAPHDSLRALFDVLQTRGHGATHHLSDQYFELCTTPYYHPLAPLLIDFDCARETQPAIALPGSPRYPGGLARAAAQLDSALAAHRSPYRVQAGPRALTVFLRDGRLSDRVGFEYGKWNSHDAAANLIAELEAIAAQSGEEAPFAGIMLDGENCWERYPYNGYHFLSALYAALEAHPTIRTTTCSGLLAARGAPLPQLPRVVAGSWVHGDFSTWIGAPEKNRAWELLCSAKQTFDVVFGSGRLPAERRAAAERQLGACEASDNFWWPGSGGEAAVLAEFDTQYRSQLANLYRLLELPVPAALAQA